MVLQYLTGKEDHYRCVKGVLGWCFNIPQEKKIIKHTCMVYLHGALISHRVRRSLETRLGSIRMVLQYLTGKEDHYRCVKGELGWCFNIPQEKKIIKHTCMVYLHGALISHRVRRSL